MQLGEETEELVQEKYKLELERSLRNLKKSKMQCNAEKIKRSWSKKSTSSNNSNKLQTSTFSSSAGHDEHLLCKAAVGSGRCDIQAGVTEKILNESIPHHLRNIYVEDITQISIKGKLLDHLLHIERVFIIHKLNVAICHRASQVLVKFSNWLWSWQM